MRRSDSRKKFKPLAKGGRLPAREVSEMKSLKAIAAVAAAALLMVAGCAPSGRVVSVNDGQGYVFDFNCDRKLLKPLPGLTKPLIATEIKDGVWYSQEEMRSKNPGLETGGWWYEGEKACGEKTEQ